MKNTYKEGNYLIKCKGRGVQSVYLNKGQAKLLFDLMKERKLEFESIEFLN